MNEPDDDPGGRRPSAGLDRKVLLAVERLGRAIRAARQQAATRHGLSLLGVGILEALDDDRPRRVGDLAAELDVTQPTTSDAVTTLEGRGLVLRRRDPQDMRSTLVSLTDSGRGVADAITDELRPLLTASDGSARADKATTLRVLLGEIARLQAAGIITVNRSCLTCHHYEAPRGAQGARCLLLAKPLPDGALRVDCPEHEPLAGPATAHR